MLERSLCCGSVDYLVEFVGLLFQWAAAEGESDVAKLASFHLHHSISLLLRWLAGVIRYTLIYLSLLFTGKEFSHFLIAHATLAIERWSARVIINVSSHVAQINISRHYL